MRNSFSGKENICLYRYNKGPEFPVKARMEKSKWEAYGPGILQPASDLTPPPPQLASC